MAQFTFPVYMSNLVRNFVAEPAALTILAFAMTWGAMGIIAYLAKMKPGQWRRLRRRRPVGVS
jgi:hypothetical protein